MKKKLAYALAFILAAVSLTGCGGTAPVENDRTPAAEESAPTGTTAPAAESQTEPAQESSAAEPTKEEQVEQAAPVEIPEKIEIFDDIEYNTSRVNEIDINAPFHETIINDVSIDPFPYKDTSEARTFYGESLYENDDKLIAYPNTATDTFKYIIRTASIDDSGVYSAQCNTRLIYNDDGDINYDTTCFLNDGEGNFTTNWNSGDDSHWIGHDKNYVNNDISELPINTLPLFVSNNIDINSGVYVDFQNSDIETSAIYYQNAVRYNLNVSNVDGISHAYYYNIKSILNHDNDIKFDYLKTTTDYNVDCVVAVYDNGRITISTIKYGRDEIILVPDKNGSGNYDGTISDLCNEDPEFSFAYNALVDGKIPFMTTIGEYFKDDPEMTALING